MHLQSPSDFIAPYGLLFTVAIALGWFLSRRRAGLIGIHPSHIDLLVPMSIGIGLIVSGVLVSEGRLRLFEILAGCIMAVFVYSRLNRLSFRSLLDVFALPSLLALGVVRIGCFIAGCCWGDVAMHEPWFAATYEPGSFAFEQQLAAGLISADALRSLPVHPVQLYAAALIGMAYLILRRMPLDTSRSGTMIAVAAIVYAVIRFAIEFIRADGTLVANGLTITQLLCLALLASGLIVAWPFAPANSTASRSPG